MRKILLMSSALVAFAVSGVAEAACIQTPTCSSLGYTSSSSCDGGIKCPFGNAWNCTIINKITEVTNKITEIINKITIIEEKIIEIEQNDGNDNGSDEGTTTPDYTNCKVGAILYSDKTCNSEIIYGKTPIGVVFDDSKHQAVALVETYGLTWSNEHIEIPNLTSDNPGKKNTKIIYEYCQSNNLSCPAAEYAYTYTTEGTSAGDWYLPSSAELKKLLNNKDKIDITLNNLNKTEISQSRIYKSSGLYGATTSFKHYYYWSSTPNESTSVDVCYFLIQTLNNISVSIDCEARDPASTGQYSPPATYGDGTTIRYITRAILSF